MTAVKAPHSTNLHEIAAATAGFMTIFEGELGDPKLIELAKAFGDHSFLLFLGHAREWKFQAQPVSELIGGKQPTSFMTAIFRVDSRSYSMIH